MAINPNAGQYSIEQYYSLIDIKNKIDGAREQLKGGQQAFEAYTSADPHSGANLLAGSLKASGIPVLSDLADGIGSMTNRGIDSMLSRFDAIDRALSDTPVAPPQGLPPAGPGMKWQPEVVVSDDGKSFSQGRAHQVPEWDYYPDYTDTEGKRIVPTKNGWQYPDGTPVFPSNDGTPADVPEIPGKNHPKLPNPFHDYFGIDRDGRFRIAWFDPLTLDLDGDGIETVAPDGWSGSLFDMDNDGIRTATGWIKSDDGLLVFDRNGNGLIDNGTELFGDHTPVSSGGFAQHGFAALADLDSNGDGRIDVLDADFNYLKVWRDLNQDGVSSTDELFTLSQLGIASLNLAYTNTNQALNGGNVLAQIGSYTKTDGTVHQMGDVNLAADLLHTEYTDQIELTPEQAAQPNIQGMGRLRDLREAAALSSKLADVLSRYSNAATKADQLALLDELLLEWAKTDPQWKDEWELAFSTSGMEDPNSSNVIWLRPGQNAAFIDLTEEEERRIRSCKRLVSILDAFSGETTKYIYFADKNTADIIESTYANLAVAVYDALLLQTRLLPYLDRIGLTLDNDGLSLDFTGVEQLFADTYATNREKAFIDLAELLGPKGDVLTESGWTSGIGLFAGWVAQAESDGSIYVYKQQLGSLFSQITSNNDFVIGGVTGEVINGGLGNDIIFGLAGNDRLEGGHGDDLLDGGDGNDVIYDLWGNNTMRGGTGSDTITGRGIFEGGTGDDTLIGQDSYFNDTYLFNLGDGRDTITDYGYVPGGGSTNDRLCFGEGISAAEVIVTRTPTDLILTLNANDQVTIKNWFNSADYWIEKIEFADGTIWTPQTFMGMTMTQEGGAGNDTLYGWEAKDILIGGAGDDKLYGGNNEDQLFGGVGNDRLEGGHGDDLLDGGDGNDVIYDLWGNNTMRGGTGNDTITGRGIFEGGTGDDTLIGQDSYFNDTYLFNLGDGRDTITDYGYVPGGGSTNDRLSFGEGIDFNELWFSRSTNDLKINIIGTEDTVTVKNWFTSSDYQIENIHTGDGKTLLSSQVQNLVNAMASFAPPAPGQTSLTVDYQQALNPVLAASWK